VAFAAGQRFSPLSRNLAIRSNRDYASALLLLQWLCAMALLVPAFRNARVVIRSRAFGTSLALLLLIPSRRRHIDTACRPISHNSVAYTAREKSDN
jgi:hypothetical protein